MAGATRSIHTQFTAHYFTSLAHDDDLEEERRLIDIAFVFIIKLSSRCGRYVLFRIVNTQAMNWLSSVFTWNTVLSTDVDTNNPPQRFKDAVDNRIQEEQARQKAAVSGASSASPRPSGATTPRPRSGSRNISPSRRRRRPEQSGQDGAQR